MCLVAQQLQLDIDDLPRDDKISRLVAVQVYMDHVLFCDACQMGYALKTEMIRNGYSAVDSGKAVTQRYDNAIFRDQSGGGDREIPE